MAWRVAASLLTLRDQINAAYPTREKGADGTIGDAAHQAQGSASDHNPDRAGVVRALDVDADLVPARPNSRDIALLIAERLIASHDVRIKYVVAGRSIAYGPGWSAATEGGADNPWVWLPYHGDPHDDHFHVSVVPDNARADDPRAWQIGDAQMTASQQLTEVHALVSALRPAKGQTSVAGTINALLPMIQKTFNEVREQTKRVLVAVSGVDARLTSIDARLAQIESRLP